MTHRLNWNPSTFEEVVALLKQPPSRQMLDFAQWCRRVGPLPCPSPPWDPNGKYRVNESWSALYIERQGDDGSWSQAEATAPKAGGVG